MDEITLPTGENIIVSYADISITGTDRSKPQIRIFSDKAVEAFKIARSEKKRFFCLTIYSKSTSFVAYMTNIILDEYIVSIETDMTDMSGRMDIRSLYEWLDSYTSASGPQDYIRCNKDNHACGIFQASFIRIKDTGTVLTEKSKEYFAIFDLRPYFITSVRSFNFAPLKEKDKRNIIAFGAPGTGKSYNFKKKLEELKCPNTNYERVTFFSDYSYAQFIGTYKPINMGGVITYKFVPGPFMRILVKALKSGLTKEPQKYYLIVEEINRAKAAAVFGDMFQLLDRDDSGASEYSINVSEDVRNYLADVFGGSATDYSELKIPNNMYIWSTMNSADQGVFPIDTAFKRRWTFNYIGVDDEEFKIISIPGAGTHVSVVENQNDTFNLADGQIEWNVLRRAINSKLSNEKIKLHEDKLMGPFFIKILDDDGNSLFDPARKDEEFIKLFSDKVLMYLFEDAVKTKRPDFFEGCDKNKLNRYSYVCSEFKNRGLDIFGSSFRTTEYAEQRNERDDKKARLES
ncbi:MAG: AAA domain-containing protein [Lachnospiraceae bacterium]|nr:AAA domain-containing protein [Lachnospiraceae bacterium]